jgi:predicted ArsR family transcriptional regulator
VEDRWSAAAALADSSRRALYDYVRRQDHPVSRVEAARAHRVSSGLAAFHLDKLVDAGLLRARYQAPPGRPRGRGRTPKVYELAQDGLSITIPERRYRLIAEILAAAVASDPADAAEAARAQAEHTGRDLGGRLREGGEDLTAVLDGLGFEPRAGSDRRLVLHNCPFHPLAARHTELICGLNHAFLTGLVDGLAAAYTPDLAPRPGACCVELTDRRPG